jgi:hypothetical protein
VAVGGVVLGLSSDGKYEVVGEGADDEVGFGFAFALGEGAVAQGVDVPLFGFFRLHNK